MQQLLLVTFDIQGRLIEFWNNQIDLAVSGLPPEVFDRGVQNSNQVHVLEPETVILLDTRQGQHLLGQPRHPIDVGFHVRHHLEQGSGLARTGASETELGFEQRQRSA